MLEDTALVPVPGRFEWERALRNNEAVPWYLTAFLLMVGTYMNADGTGARPSVAELCRVTRLKRSRVHELLAEAEHRGWLTSHGPPGKVRTRLPAIPSYPQPIHNNPSTEPDLSSSVDGSSEPDGLPAVTRPPQWTGGSSGLEGTRPAHWTQQSQDHSVINHLPRARAPAAARLAAEAGATEEEIRALVARLRAERPDITAPLRWLARCHDAGDLDAMLARQRTDAAAEARRQWGAWCDTQAPCPHGVAGGDQAHPDTGTPRCALCRTAQHRAERTIHNG